MEFGGLVSDPVLGKQGMGRVWRVLAKSPERKWEGLA